jgi:hypothetical protein
MSKNVTLPLQKAIAMAHAGKMDEARSLAEEVIQDDPENEHALYLMSALADTDEDRQGYLNQVLLVNPEHADAMKYSDEIASDQLMQVDYSEPIAETVEDLDLDEIVIGQEEQLPVSQGTQDFIEQSDGNNVPDWLADEDGFYEEPTEAELTDKIEPLPEWLEEEPVSAEEKEVAAAAMASATVAGADVAGADAAIGQPLDETVTDQELDKAAAPERKKAKRRGPSDKLLTIFLVILIVVAMVIMGGIAYLVITQLL